MKLFDGTAYFSPSVSSAIKDAWAIHGGTVAETLEQKQFSQWYFCSGASDPCITILQTRPAIIFHSDWILAAVTSRFSLPLNEYVLDERYSKNTTRNLAPAKEAQGSHLIGILHEVSEIKAQINKPAANIPTNTVSTRLSTAAEPGHSSKRPYDSSPEQSVGQESRLIKKIKLQSEEPSPLLQMPQTTSSQINENAPARLQTQFSSLSAPINASLSSPIFTSNRTNAYSARSPFYVSHGATKERFYFDEQSDSFNIDASEPKISGMNKRSRDRPQLTRNPQTNVSGDAESWIKEKASSSSASRPDPLDLNSDSTHPESLAFTESNIWISLIHNAASHTGTNSEVDDADSNSDHIPTICVSDVMDALKSMDADRPSPYDDEVVPFRAGVVFRERKFSVDTGERRKTI